MNFDYSRLCGRITEKCKTQGNFAKAMGPSESTISAKLNNKYEFSQSEIMRAVEILELRSTDIPLYFFTLKV